MNDKYSVLIIAEAANPDWVSVPLVGWSLANALRSVDNVHIVTHIRNSKAIQKQGLKPGEDFTAIDSEAIDRPMWRLTNLLRGGQGKGWTTGTAIKAFSYYYFEYLLWKKFGNDIQHGKYDIVHRVTPLSPTIPSLIAKKCHRANVPFVVGPLNGGVPWPKEFDSARRKEREWLSYIRNAYKLMPGYRGMLKYASALIIGSKDTLKKVPEKFHEKCVYIPENAIEPERFSEKSKSYIEGPLRACFVGRLVPYKCPDILLEAALPLIKEGRLEIDIIGDGPLMSALANVVANENIDSAVTLTGWIEHAEVQKIMCKSQVFAFPSIREFGGGVVLEAMALGLVPVIVDYAGPGELVIDGTGYKIPLGTREKIVQALQNKLRWLVDNPESLPNTAKNAKTRVLDYFTWREKANQVHEVYKWILDDRKNKPLLFKE